MELAQIRYFLAVCRTRNFSKAAEELFITQPTLSQQLKRLENELGVTLFERSTRSVLLTETGEACREYAQAVVDNVDKITAIAGESQRKQSGSLKVGVLTVLPHLNVTEALVTFQRDYPNVTTSMEFGWSVDLLAQLSNKELDVVISNVFDPTEEKYQDLDIQVFHEDRMCAVLSKKHPLADQKKIRLSELADEVFWLDPSSSVAIRLNQLAQEQGVRALKVQEIHSMTSVFKMVEANMGVSVMSRSVAKEYLRPGTRCIPLDPKDKTQTALVTRKNKRRNSTAALFEEYFLKHIETSH